jgi:hypothetical protein
VLWCVACALAGRWLGGFLASGKRGVVRAVAVLLCMVFAFFGMFGCGRKEPLEYVGGEDDFPRVYPAPED